MDTYKPGVQSNGSANGTGKKKRKRKRNRTKNNASGLAKYKKKKKRKSGGRAPEIVPEAPGIISGKALADNLRKNSYIYGCIQSMALLKLKVARENLPLVNPDTGEVVRILLPYKRIPRKVQHLLSKVQSDQDLGNYKDRSKLNWSILQQLAARNFTADEVAIVIATNPYLACHYIPSKQLRREIKEKGSVEAFLECGHYIRQVASDYMRALKKRFRKADYGGVRNAHDELDQNVQTAYEFALLFADISKTLELDNYKHALKQSALIKVLIEIASRVYPFNNHIPRNLSEIGLHAGVDRKSVRAALRKLGKLGIIHTTEKMIADSNGKIDDENKPKRPIYFISLDFDRIKALLSAFDGRLEEYGQQRPKVDTLLVSTLFAGAAATKRRGTLASRKEVYRERIVRQIIAKAHDMSIFGLSPAEFQARFNVSSRTARRHLAILKEYFDGADTPEEVLKRLLEADEKALPDVYRASVITIQISLSYRLYFMRHYKSSDVDRIWGIILASRIPVPDSPEESRQAQ